MPIFLYFTSNSHFFDPDFVSLIASLTATSLSSPLYHRVNINEDEFY